MGKCVGEREYNGRNHDKLGDGTDHDDCLERHDTVLFYEIRVLKNERTRLDMNQTNSISVRKQGR